MAIEATLPPQVPVRRAVRQVCCCGSNQTWHSVFLALNLISGLFAVALLVLMLIAAADLHGAEGAVIGISISGLVLTLIHLMFVITGVAAEQKKSAKLMRIWSVYTKIMAVLQFLGFIFLFFEPFMFPSWVWSTFMSILLAILSSLRHQELLLLGNAEGRDLVAIEQEKQTETMGSAPEKEMEGYQPPPPYADNIV